MSLLIERVAELECQKSWAQIRQTLETLQVTEFQTPDHKFFTGGNSWKIKRKHKRYKESIDMARRVDGIRGTREINIQ